MRIGIEVSRNQVGGRQIQWTTPNYIYPPHFGLYPPPQLSLAQNLYVLHCKLLPSPPPDETCDYTILNLHSTTAAPLKSVAFIQSKQVSFRLSYLTYVRKKALCVSILREQQIFFRRDNFSSSFPCKRSHVTNANN
jgi:hypothetical protein